MTHDELRLECLKLAHTDRPNCTDNEAIIEWAKTYADFVIDSRSGSPQPAKAEPSTPETEADPRNPNLSEHEGKFVPGRLTT